MKTLDGAAGLRRKASTVKLGSEAGSGEAVAPGRGASHVPSNDAAGNWHCLDCGTRDNWLVRDTFRGSNTP